MRTALLISLYAVWPLTLVAAQLISGVRIRFLLVQALGWVFALVIATTGMPAPQAPPVGLIVGASTALFLAFAVNEGVTFTWSQDKTYFVQEGRPPRAEHVVLAVVGLVDVAGVVLTAVG